jgi:SAM-dependent methyltransferase
VSDPPAAPVHAPLGGSADADGQECRPGGGPGLEGLLRWGRQRGAARVLDIASGGHTTLALASFTPTVVGTDIALSRLTEARAFVAGHGATGVHFLAADAGALPFRDESFGVATCRNAAHHFPELLPAFRQIARVLRRGGSFLAEDCVGHDDPELAAFILEVRQRRDPSHVRSYRQVEWTAFLRAAGLTVIDDAVLGAARRWEEWTARLPMSPAAKAALERFVLHARSRCLEAFEFRIEDSRILGFTERLLLLRADKD